jgi:phage-related protein
VKTEVPKIIIAVVQWFNSLPTKIGYAIGLAIGTLAKWAVHVKNWIKTEAPKIIANIVTFFTGLPGKIASAISSAVGKVSAWARDMVAKVKTEAPKIISHVVAFFAGLPAKIGTEITKAVTSVKAFGESVVNWARYTLPGKLSEIISQIERLPGQALNAGADLVRGLWNGIINMKNWIINKVKDFAQSILDGIKRAMGISSPSTVMRDQVGKNLVAGMAEGITGNTGLVKSAMAGLNSNLVTTARTDLNINSFGGGKRGTAAAPNGAGGIVIHVHGNVNSEASARTLGETIGKAINQRSRALGVVPA